ncbi:MAG TPA: hypothetical protein VFZ34_31065 [Blastocatellia bacterium]|nr:hypothetical protein [Blastocatellia bacterium]
MPRRTSPNPPSTLDALQAELNKFADGAMLRDTAFIKALCQSLQEQALAYYHAGASPAESLQHLEEITKVFKKIKFKTNGKQFTIAAKEVKSAVAGVPAYTCTPPMVCIGGLCVLPGNDNERGGMNPSLGQPLSNSEK